MQQTKTDNSHLPEKVKLRLDMLPEGDVNVLDCFGGRGTIWKDIGRKRPLNRYIAIEKEKGKNPAAICGDNSKILPRLDLASFNVIDLDAYGMPISQIKSVLENPTLQQGTVVFITFIYMLKGNIPHEIAPYINATGKMFSKCKTLFIHKMREALDSLLHAHGIKEYRFYEFYGSMHKLYVGFRF